MLAVSPERELPRQQELDYWLAYILRPLDIAKPYIEVKGRSPDGRRFHQREPACIRIVNAAGPTPGSGKFGPHQSGGSTAEISAVAVSHAAVTDGGLLRFSHLRATTRGLIAGSDMHFDCNPS